MTQEIAIPSDPMAEETVLGSLMIDHTAVLNVSGFLAASDFYAERNGWIYAAILDLNERRQPADFALVCSELERRGQLAEVGGEAYLTKLINNVASVAYTEHYAHIVEQAATLRKLIDVSGQIAGLAWNREAITDSQGVLSKASTLLHDLVLQRSRESHVASLDEILHKTLNDIEVKIAAGGVMPGVTSGWPKIDYLLSGWQPGTLNVLGARPSIGKTTWATCTAISVAKAVRDKRVLMLSMEMTDIQIVSKILASEAGINSRNVQWGDLTTEDFEHLMDAANRLHGLDMVINWKSSWNPARLAAECQRQHLQHPLSLIVLDYLQLMSGSERNSENRNQEISRISRSLKQLAQDLEVPILCLSQLSRAAEYRGADSEPELTDLRDSGAIEQDADTVIFLSREVMQGTLDAKGVDKSRITKVKIAKNRIGGKTGFLPMHFDYETSRFNELSDEVEGREESDTSQEPPPAPLPTQPPPYLQAPLLPKDTPRVHDAVLGSRDAKYSRGDDDDTD